MATPATGVDALLGGRAENDHQEEERADEFGDEGGGGRIVGPAVLAEAVLGEVPAAADGRPKSHIEHARANDRADALGNDIADEIACREPARRPGARRNRRIDVAAGHRADAIDRGPSAVRPKARAMASTPSGAKGVSRTEHRAQSAAKVTEPQPKKTRAAVPMTSAIYFFIFVSSLEAVMAKQC